MFKCKLINPQIVMSDGMKYRFDNTLVIYMSEQEINRVGVNLPYDMPDSEIELLMIVMLENYAKEIDPNPIIDSSITWDWPEWDMPL